jgi:cytochrome c oxidase cbb3-type subunit 4
MDMGTFRGIVTVVLMTLFVGLVIWAYSRRRRADFTQAAALPLEEDDASPRTETH